MRGKKVILLLSVLICIFFVTSVLCGSVVAEQLYVEIEGEPTYHCYKTTDAGYYYFINVTFCNSGDEDATPIDISVIEKVGKEYQSLSPPNCTGIVIGANDCKTVTIDWITVSATKNIEIKWSPSLPNEDKPSGSKNLTVIHDSVKDTNDTPGFEIPIVVLALCILFYIRRFELKKYR